MGCSHSTHSITPKPIMNVSPVMEIQPMQAAICSATAKKDGALERFELRARDQSELQKTTRLLDQALLEGEIEDNNSDDISKRKCYRSISLPSYIVKASSASRFFPTSSPKGPSPQQLGELSKSRDLRITPMRCGDCTEWNDNKSSVASPHLPNHRRYEREDSHKEFSAVSRYVQMSKKDYSMNIKNANNERLKVSDEVPAFFPIVKFIRSNEKQMSDEGTRRRLNLGISQKLVEMDTYRFISKSSPRIYSPKAIRKHNIAKSAVLTEDQVKTIANEVRRRLISRNTVDSKTIIDKISSNSRSESPVSKDLLAALEFARDLQRKKERSQSKI